MGHGWVKPNASGAVARCGGPALCPDCQKEQAELEAPAKVIGRPGAAPTIGRAVHYHDPKYGLLAATVSGLFDNGDVWLSVFANQMMPNDVEPVIGLRSPYDPDKSPGSWSWPPRI